jgi:hypothetical protein
MKIINLSVKSHIDNSAVLEKYSPPATRVIKQPLTGQMAMDVYGQQIEPICSYRTCSHKFSIHGHSGSSKCKFRTFFDKNIFHNDKLQNYHYGQNREIISLV